ncbi:hypothetical protein SLOPH_639 [Spraguea lophii 42_110]|uniref:Uncharacterized protein n=1 Tax=Spraguea lophii (strain 42_110) TaxID=1358809 RepID=S7XFL6_SPRLO|nr:hypothetical protein SLOPH_639 [Spraguea lophii 42_110]
MSKSSKKKDNISNQNRYSSTIKFPINLSHITTLYYENRYIGENSILTKYSIPYPCVLSKEDQNYIKNRFKKIKPFNFFLKFYNEKIDEIMTNFFIKKFRYKKMIKYLDNNEKYNCVENIHTTDKNYNFKLVKTTYNNIITYPLNCKEINKRKELDVNEILFNIKEKPYKKIIIINESALKRINEDYFLDAKTEGKIILIEKWYNKKITLNDLIELYHHELIPHSTNYYFNGETMIAVYGSCGKAYYSLDKTKTINLLVDDSKINTYECEQQYFTYKKLSILLELVNENSDSIINKDIILEKHDDGEKIKYEGLRLDDFIK